MRFAVLLLCLIAAGCAGGPSGPESIFTTSAPVSAPVEDEPAPPPRSSGNTRTAAAAQPPVSDEERQTQARADCWMKVERDRANARNIDRRAAAVDKCVADAMKRTH